MPDNAYGPGKELARHELARWGITHRFYDPIDPAALAAMIGPAHQAGLARGAGLGDDGVPRPARAGARGARQAACSRALDNTWGAGLAFDAFDLGDGLGVDISAQALTKYPSGGGDVLMGSVTTRDDALHLRLKGTHMRMGWGVGANDVEAVLRSLPSLPLRYARAGRAGRTLAQWWQQQPQVSQVLHPALPGSPGHEHWARAVHAGRGAVLGGLRRAPRRARRCDAFVDALQLFKLGYSWAGPVSLVVPYDLAVDAPGPAWRGTLVRFSHRPGRRATT